MLLFWAKIFICAIFYDYSISGPEFISLGIKLGPFGALQVFKLIKLCTSLDLGLDALPCLTNHLWNTTWPIWSSNIHAYELPRSRFLSFSFTKHPSEKLSEKSLGPGALQGKKLIGATKTPRWFSLSSQFQHVKCLESIWKPIWELSKTSNEEAPQICWRSVAVFQELPCFPFS